jgi:hypothetical protein
MTEKQQTSRHNGTIKEARIEGEKNSWKISIKKKRGKAEME